MSGKVIPVRVALRARPLIQKEENEGCQTCLWFNSNEPQVVIGKDKAFTFDYVFSPKDNQQDVYEKAVRKLVRNTFKGYHATVLAYGQTGSGKTYSMGGCYEASLLQDEEMMGIIPRILKDLFSGIQERPDCDFKVRVSYLEIYNEDLLDLLCMPAQRQPLSIREEINGEIKIKGLKEMNVSTLDETLQCLAQGARYRTTGATAMNDTSSRSHAIFTVHVDCAKKDDVNDGWQAKFHLVDLAGSERAKKTRAEGDRFKEGVNINKGLLALGNVISALGEDTAKRGHIPYRDSKLTRLLQDSLGGNSHTLMVACVSPADSNMEETLNTLRYADRARKIKNKPVINRDPQSDEIIRLREIVQSLQLQLLHRGGACSNVNSESSLLSSISTESREELTKLTERAKQLEEENTELTRELQSAVDQNTRMFGSIIQLEASRDRLKNKLRSFKQDTGVDFELLSSSLDVESNPQMKAELEKLRKLTDQVKDNNADTDEEADTVEEDEEVPIAERDAEHFACNYPHPSVLGPGAANVARQVQKALPGFETGNVKFAEDGLQHKHIELLVATKLNTNEDAAPDTPDSRAMNTRHALRQAQMSRELQELNRILSRKQELASQMDRSEEEMATMRAHYEKLMQEWEGKVSQLEKEKEELSVTLFDARTNANATKVSEQRRKRLQELEQEMAQLKRKMADQAKILKLKDSSEKQVSRLNVEIQSLKQQRVKLMKQMKEENDVWRRWKQQKDKEVLQLMQKDRKRQAELAKLQQTNEKQQSVLKRKVEEAAAANRRLKEALSRQKAVLAERSTKMDTCDATSIGNRVRKWLSHELDVRVSLREARYHMEALMADRKELSQQMRHLKERIGEASPSKKYLWMDDSGSRGEKSFEEEEIRKQIEVLATEIELRNVQIQDLQQKICDADQESKGKSVWEGLHTMMEAKCALKWLLDQAVDAKAERTTLQGELKDVHQMSESNREVEQELLTKMKRLQKVHEEELLQLRKEHEQKTLLLLGVNHKKTNNKANDKTLKAKLDIMEAELAKMSSLSDELEKKKEECEELKRHMTGLMYDGKLALMPSIDDPHASPFLTPRPKLQAKHPVKNAPGKVFQPETPGGFTDLESEEDDEKNDPSWKASSVLTRNLPKRSSSSSCGCKGNCDTKRCSCSKNNRHCNSGCACDFSGCVNKVLEAASSSSILNSTFCVDSQNSKDSDDTLESKATKENIRPRMNSKSKLLGMTSEARSSEEYEKPEGESVRRNKRSGEINLQPSSLEESLQGLGMKRKKKMLSSNVSYFGPLA